MTEVTADSSTNDDDNVLQELKKIRELLTPAPAPAAGKGLKNEFLFFLQQYKVLGLAVAFIMGLYLGGVVQSLAQQLIIPGIGLVVPGLKNLSSYTATVNNQVFGIGPFLVAVVTFAIVALVIFLIVKIATSWGLNK
jgi:large conductance mechanosensitive channel